MSDSTRDGALCDSRDGFATVLAKVAVWVSPRARAKVHSPVHLGVEDHNIPGWRTGVMHSSVARPLTFMASSGLARHAAISSRCDRGGPVRAGQALWITAKLGRRAIVVCATFMLRAAHRMARQPSIEGR